ncbi:MAG: hypothetical protein CMP18_01145 [Rickettsiales bacterium]|nr:hypothetical protein [Rickettsiales bacterium]
MSNKNILFIGCGKMGGVIIDKITNNKNLANNYYIIDPKNLDSQFNGSKNISLHTNLADIDNDFCADVIFLNIKPQNSAEIINEISRLNIYNNNTIFISIIAGKNLDFFTNILGQNIKIVRTMPNLAIQYSHGIMPYKLSSNCSNDDKILITAIFDNFGEIFEVSDEKLFDIITAIFGSGPAYIFYIQELIKNIAISNGLDQDIAEKLIKELFLGSALIAKNSNKTFNDLIKDVTSKEGVTQSLMDNLQKSDSLNNIFRNAINKAKERSKELNQ